MDVLVSFSREDIGKVDLEKWKQENVRWLQETFNRDSARNGENVISVVFMEMNVEVHTATPLYCRLQRMAGSVLQNSQGTGRIFGSCRTPMEKPWKCLD